VWRRHAPHIVRSAPRAVYHVWTLLTPPRTIPLREVAFSTGCYTCTVNVGPNAAGSLPLIINGVIMATPYGTRVQNATGVDGAIVIEPSR